MCMDHYQQSRTWTMVLENFNLFFIVIFTSEMLMKMFALRHHYFKDAWNLFDFVVVMMSLLSLFFSELIEKYFVSPTLLRVVSSKTTYMNLFTNKISLINDIPFTSHSLMESPSNGAWNRELLSEQFINEHSDILAEHFSILCLHFHFSREILAEN